MFFDDRKENWKSEGEKLKLLLNDKEYKDAAHSTLSSFYTPVVQSLSRTVCPDRYGIVLSPFPAWLSDQPFLQQFLLLFLIRIHKYTSL